LRTVKLRSTVALSPQIPCRLDFSIKIATVVSFLSPHSIRAASRASSPSSIASLTAYS
jgi:hypothetical protein